LEDRGGEVGVAIGRHNKGKVSNSTKPDFEVTQDLSNVSECSVTLSGAGALVGFEPGFNKGALVLGEPGLFLLAT